jgi:glycosyltransferase involved in cell wall biosynthesis
MPDDVLGENDKGIIGIWKEHWANLMCDEMLKISDAYEFEIWQPDHRADKVYTHRFENGLKHNLFPFGKNTDNPEHNYNTADLSLFFDYISSFKIKPVVHLHEFGNPITQDALRMIDRDFKVVLLQYGGFTYREASRHGKNLLRRFNYYRKSIEEKQILKKVREAIVMNKRSEFLLREVYGGPISENNMGIDFSYWKQGDKNKSREELNINKDSRVILSASMIREKKQIDSLVKAFLKIEEVNTELDYFLIIAGGGDKEYERYVKELASELTMKNKIRFTGRISNEELLKYYNASDLFVLVSSGEGSPVSIMKAHSCGLPVITTDFGQAPEILRKHNCGYVVKNNYEDWVEPIRKFIEKETNIIPLDCNTAADLYSWKNVSQKFIGIYNKL